MATSYARLGQAATDGDPGPSRVLGAMQTHPFLVGGTDRFDTILIEETDGRVISKVGAEGVHSAVCLEQGIGVAVKVEDGAARAQYPALLRALQLLDVLPAKLPPREAGYQPTSKYGQSCAMCQLFRPPHACQIVAGEISPDGWCKFFSLPD